MQYKTHHSTRFWARYRLRSLRFIMMCFVPWLGSVFASEESFVPWGDVDITCPDISDIGIVRFRAKAESFRVVSVSVEAFGRQYTLSDDQIRQIEDFPLSSLSITCEGGYKELGGPAVHFKFQRIFHDASTVFRERRLVISLHKDSDIRISRVPDDIMSSDRAKAILDFTDGWAKRRREARQIYVRATLNSQPALAKIMAGIGIRPCGFPEAMRSKPEACLTCCI